MKPRTVTLVWTALVLAWLALVIGGQDSGWRRLQATFQELELERYRAELDATRQNRGDVRAELGRELDEARRAAAGRAEEADRLELDLRHLRSAERWAARDLERLERVAGTDARRAARRQLEERRAAVATLERQLADLRSQLDSAETRHAQEHEDDRRLEERIADLERRILLRRVPGWRGLDPSLAVVEVAVAGSADRVDRCMTCHLGAGRSGGDTSWPAPFAPHSGSLVVAGLVHAPERIGCTVCHGGDGRATDFTRAGHWPANRNQEAQWVRRWGFSRRAAPDGLILPGAWAEAGCAACHQGHTGYVSHGTELRSASLDHGRLLVERMGCTGCHAEAMDRPRPRRGPPLGELAAKTTPEWAYHWIVAPRRFRASTWMPHFFPDGADEPRRTATVGAMVRYLWSVSAPPPEPDPPPEGDEARGAELFASAGCMGCHLLDADAARDQVAPRRLHGPNLARSGNKVRPGWLYAWLLDPRAYRGDTPMPSLRLSEAEAADLTAYLLASRDPGWEALTLPAVDPAVRDELVRAHLEEELTLAESEVRFAGMGSEEKDLYLGRRSLRTYGCHGCHHIPGLTGAPPPAAPWSALDVVAQRRVHGSAAELLEHAHRASPAAAGPDYAMSRSEANAVLVGLLSAGRRADPGMAVAPRLEGEPLLDHYGCLGCHRLERRGGAIAETLADPTLRPPSLTSVGARFRAPWLLEYLNDPGAHVRRPWLGIRMPSFDLPGEDAAALVRFFAARDGQPLLPLSTVRPQRRDVEVGRVIADMMACQRCHHAASEARDLPPRDWAPSYRGIRQRLRPEWVVDWILDPQGHLPGTSMPAIFRPGTDGDSHDAAYLIGTISSPMFDDARRRLLPLFESEAELFTYLSDARRVAAALRDYLWTVED